jgi:pimeloyl-ACP methyl ester carboxylesterase
MAKTKMTKGQSRNGIPYVRFGIGPRILVCFMGGPGNDMPPNFMLQLMISRFKRFVDYYTIYMLTRKLDQPTGYSTQDMSNDYATMIRNELEWPVDVWGTSYGGLIAQHFAADHPDLIRRLVIGVAAYRVSDAGKELDSRVAVLKSQGRWGKAYATEMSGIFQRGPLKYFSQFLMLLFGVFMRSTPSNASDFLIEAEAEVNHDSKQRLAEIKVPTLVIGGDQDFFFPVELYRETATGIPNAKLILYEGLGHNVAGSKRFAEDVLTFLIEKTYSAVRD